MAVCIACSRVVWVIGGVDSIWGRIGHQGLPRRAGSLACDCVGTTGPPIELFDWGFGGLEIEVSGQIVNVPFSSSGPNYECPLFVVRIGWNQDIPHCMK